MPSKRRKPLTAAQAKLLNKARLHGGKRAEAVVKGRRPAAAAKLGAVPKIKEVLLAEGDSWFDYPGDDVLSILEKKHGFRIESVAHMGDTVEDMAYGAAQLQKLERAFRNLKEDGRVPRAILLSGGGNDIAGTEFAILLNHAASDLPVLNEHVVKGVVDERMMFAIGSLIASVTRLSNLYFQMVIPVLVHGYANPVPDGRGYLGGFWVLPGPWLKPGFAQKGHLPDGDPAALKACTTVLEELMKRFNALLQSLAGSQGYEHVTYVDVRGLLKNTLPKAYKDDWDNELHPTDDAFERVAAAFVKALPAS